MESDRSYDAIVDDIGSKVDHLAATEPAGPSVSASYKGIDKRIIVGGVLFVAVVAALYYFKPSLITEEKSENSRSSPR
jgi:hypothetical protein